MFVQNLQGNIKYSYDYDHDVLYIYFGEPKVSYDDEAAPGVFIRFSEEDDVITGVVIMDYKKRDVDAVTKHIPIRINFHSINEQLHGIRACHHPNFVEDW
ncbi:hypothetical protein JV16_01813 [Anoxybacillus ayderensis]|uniref:DUF2283 domain-containing protein n=2 Tax=Anoxybacillus ayderensis TaxID=265546 RepID=A0A0D0HT66_9BACL|nr:DUF2283 domain-containing protein [Anoxybacillus ayderensis]EPZ37188.1 hypothetical protein C289_2781 [Anoxybacillus ayderensis]KHF27291.1 hypothetical protein LR68_03892 [Anoxybacillus sp. BCO1]KIP21088.1 hypothetical protein JV16_01813 [Anoxybacillus ayderensis]